ncbi:16S rRNA (uracil(1498)-N(3))-methyltransferase [Luteolibacter sp. Populi]|uniref:16S rRNA (uracil(1498)-N(3))-methyltransferase n=1 Tax=Luteolibacter sp. Populi TaxID=3230487 RepID=UPI003465AD48
MPRFHLPPEAWLTNPALTGEEAKHAAQVMRLRSGDSITVFDGLGRSAPAEVTTVSKSEIRLLLGEPVQAPPLRPAICLAQAVPKGKTMDLIVQKAVELGVSSIQPLITRRTIVQVDEDDADRKAAKWQRVALEACKQCGQDLIPRIEPPKTFAEWLPHAGEGIKIVASLYPGTRPLKEILRAFAAPGQAALLIGPEGDFTEDEAAAAIAAGFQAATLGLIVLRAETAAFFGISALRYEFA